MITVIGQFWVMQSPLEGMQEDERKGCPTPGQEPSEGEVAPTGKWKSHYQKRQKAYSLLYQFSAVFTVGRELRHRVDTEERPSFWSWTQDRTLSQGRI